jgi:uncharacterized membrane protein YkvI
MPSENSSPIPLQEVLTDAIRYWEPRRIVFNLALAAIVAGWVVATWPHFRAGLAFEPLLTLVVLGVLANLCYSTAYVADLPMQLSAFRAAWRRRRWMLWVAGTVFANMLSYYWMGDEIYPGFGK